MLRRRGIVAALLLIGAVAATAWFKPRSPEAFPLAELVPADAVFYAGFPDPASFEAFLGAVDPRGLDDWRRRSVPYRPHLAGAVALYLDRAREPVVLVRLRRLSAAAANGEIDGDALVHASSLEALARHRARSASILSRADFRELGARGFADLAALGVPGDFSSAGFEIGPGPGLAARGRVLYRPGAFRAFLERRVHAPGHAPAGSFTWTEPLAPLWDDVLARLDKTDRERAERAAEAVARDQLGGVPVPAFLARLGPRCGLQLGPAPGDLQLWVDVPDADAPAARAAIVRAAADGARARARRELPPWFTLREDGDRVHVQLPPDLAARWSPAFRFEDGRFVLWTGSPQPLPPRLEPGPHHVTLDLDPAATLARIAAEAPRWKDLGWTPPAGDAGRRLEGLGRLRLAGRFTSEGLRFEAAFGPP